MPELAPVIRIRLPWTWPASAVVGRGCFREPMFPQPEFDLGHLPVVVHVQASPLLQRVDAPAHPLLRQQTFMEIFKTVWPHHGHTHVSKPDITLGVSVAVH